MHTRLLFVLCALLLPLGAAAQQYPKLKPGLWDMNRGSDRPNAPGMHMSVCVDESLQKEMWEMGAGAMKGMCSKTDFHMSGNTGSGEFICNMGGSTMHSKSTMTVTGDTAWHTDVDTTFDPPLNGAAKSHSTLDARYVGACKPGQRPGDMTLPNGQTINMRDMAGGRMPPGAPPK
jgi:hypothetical protein